MAFRRWLGALLVLVLVAACLSPILADDAVPAHKKKAKKKKGYDYDKSRYKAYGVLIDPSPHTYRFDENGNPVPPPGSKKKSTKKKRTSEPGDDAAASTSACGQDACGGASATAAQDAPPPEAPASADAD